MTTSSTRVRWLQVNDDNELDSMKLLWLVDVDSGLTIQDLGRDDDDEFNSVDLCTLAWGWQDLGRAGDVDNVPTSYLYH